MDRLNLPIKTKYDDGNRGGLSTELDSLCDLMRTYDIRYEIVWPPNEYWRFWSISGLDDNDATKLMLLW